MHIFDDYKSAEKFLKKTLFADNKVGQKNATWCIIPAGGSGKRFKSNIPKQYISLNGITLLERSVASLLKFPDRASLACIILIVSREDKYCEFLNSRFLLYWLCLVVTPFLIGIKLRSLRL